MMIKKNKNLEEFAKWRQRYHKRRAKTHPEEYPDYKKKGE